MVTSYGKGQYAAAEQHVGIFSRSYKPDGTKRAVLWCHSAGGDALEPVIATNAALPLLQMITDLGAPVISCDLGGNGTWGNDTAQARITDALAYIRTAFGAHASLAPIIVGVSMGGINALNWARANPALVRALALLYPVVNLQAQHDGTGGATATVAGTEAAYGGAAGFTAAVASHDPAQNTASHSGKPIGMWWSSADTVVGTANQDAFAAAVGAGGSLETHRISGAVHADMSKIDTTQLQGFLRRYL